MKEACRLCGRLRVLDSTVPEVIKNFDFTWVLPMVLPEREGLFCGSVCMCVCGGGVYKFLNPRRTHACYKQEHEKR